MGDQRQHRRLDADHASTKSSASSTCRSKMPTSDLYGGHRPGNNLFGDSLVCVDLKTGQRKWHFQIVHHPIWDYDMSSAPLLADIIVDGKPIKAVAQPTKQGLLYVFDRVTGSRSGRSKRSRCRRPTCPARRPRRRSRSRPSRRPTRATASARERSDRLHAGAEGGRPREAANAIRLGPVFLPPVSARRKARSWALTVGNAERRRQLAGLAPTIPKRTPSSRTRATRASRRSAWSRRRRILGLSTT